MSRILTLSLLGALGMTGCPETGETDTEDTDVVDTDDTDVEYPDVSDAIDYRDLSNHPGCSTADLTYTNATIAGYNCAAREFTGTEDTTKPIVLLIHGNSDSPSSWMAYESGGACGEPGPTEGDDMLAEELAAAGYKVLALDMRYLLGDDPAGNNDTENAAKNMDHGWGVPLAQHFIGSVLEAYPDRQISIIGFSMGVTVARDAVRRLTINDEVAVLPRIDDMIMLAGANHGVSSYPLCATNPTMRGQVTCEMGDRAAYSPTEFMTPLNGPDGAYETPCSDGLTAWERPVCDGHSVEYTTIVMEDLGAGEQQDAFVSEASSALNGADNQTIGLDDVDQSNYFFCGFFKNHYGAARSDAARAIILNRLAD